MVITAKGVHCTDMPLVLLNKPCGVLCQFRDDAGRSTLADFVTLENVYPAGRLDRDSEGLLLLTDDGRLQARITQPKSKTPKTYWAQVEGDAQDLQLDTLTQGVTLKDGPAAALAVARIEPPAQLWPRDPPIRHRLSVRDCWLQITINEGRNRQVRRMTAAVGLPTLRLIRCSIGPWSLEGLRPGESREIETDDAWAQLRAAGN
jgi:23S rRNA pseudouridine2457 synthase